ncbi:MAG: hypothetical protein ACKOX6_09815 [Bdellovibrio sp.]
MSHKKSFEMPADGFEKFTKELRKLSNTAKYDKAHALCKAYLKKYPDSVFCAYREAVFSAEENTGYTPAQIKVRHKSAANKLKALLPRLSLRKFMQKKARGSFAFVGQKFY